MDGRRAIAFEARLAKLEKDHRETARKVRVLWALLGLCAFAAAIAVLGALARGIA